MEEYLICVVAIKTYHYAKNEHFLENEFP